jgi:hypothetical protein
MFGVNRPALFPQPTRLVEPASHGFCCHFQAMVDLDQIWPFEQNLLYTFLVG